jgi:hypothetical protein
LHWYGAFVTIDRPMSILLTKVLVYIIVNSSCCMVLGFDKCVYAMYPLL